MENVIFGEDDDDVQMPSTSQPQPPAMPRNGTIKTYDNPTRRFDNPYTAKTVYFYKEGDVFFAGVRLPISDHRYRNMHTVMDDLNKAMFLPYGVRRITTPMGRNTVTNVNELQHLGHYVASSSNPPKGVDLNKIQEKFSATLRRELPQKTAGGQSYWMPTSPNRTQVFRAFRLHNVISAKLVLFVLNAKGTFHKELINPMKIPPMEQVLNMVSAGLGIAIHTLWTPDGRLITTVEDILAYDGLRIIACPRNERPHINEEPPQRVLAQLSEVKPSRYAARQAFKFENTTSPVAAQVSNNSSGGNSIEKSYRERPSNTQNQRYIPRKRREQSATQNGLNGSTNGPSTSSAVPTVTPYMPKTFSDPKPKRTVIPRVAQSKITASRPAVTAAKNMVQASSNLNSKKEKTAKKVEETLISSAGSTVKTQDSGTGDSIIQSISSSQQSDRPQSMTEMKAQMIREEFKRANGQPSTSEEYSEEDRIIEEDSDYEHVGSQPIESGTDDDDETMDGKDRDSALGTTSKQSPLPRGMSSSHRTTAQHTPSSSGSNRSESEVKVTSRRLKKPKSQTASRQDTPYVATPSRPSTTSSSRPMTSESQIPEDPESEDSEDSEDSEEELEDVEVETPAAQTPDTRIQTAKSRESTRSSMRSFASESSKAWSRISHYSDKEVLLPSSEDEEQIEETPILGGRQKPNQFEDYDALPTPEKERLGLAANTIKKAMKTYAVKSKKVKFDAEQDEKNQEYEKTLMDYTIEVLIGDRFGTDFDTDLYFILVNDEGAQTEKFYQNRKENWLFSSIYGEDRRKQPKEDQLLEVEKPPDGEKLLDEGKLIKDVWLVMHTRQPCIGTLRSIIVGHEMEGYGAGTYIDRITVSENTMEGRRFMFHVEKWFDSGQVDGLIERTIPLSSMMYERPVREGERRRTSKGRWEFRLHTNTKNGIGTTSGLTVIGYGPHDYHMNQIPNDSLLQDPTAIALVQCDFGVEFGQLLKVRIEINGDGDRPNYFLEYVEAQDLDTKERCVLMVHDWLIKVPEKKNQRWQPFREFAIFINGLIPTPVRTFEGTVKLSDESLMKLKQAENQSDDPKFYLQYFAMNDGPVEIQSDSSGVFPVLETISKSGKRSYTYKVDFVLMDKVPRIRVIPKTTSLGSDVLEGMSVLRDVYDGMVDREIMPKSKVQVQVPIAEELFIEEILQKGGDHIPYDTCYSRSTVEFEANNKYGPYFKQFHPSIGLPAPTARKWKKSEKEHTKVEARAEWQLDMSLTLFHRQRPIIPTVTLVAKDRRTFQMDCHQTIPDSLPPNGTLALRYNMSCENFGNPHKIRVSCEEIEENRQTYIHKMILCERQSNTHVFFKVAAELYEFGTLEQECAYPDVGTMTPTYYELHFRTLEGGGEFRPYINLIGINGDSGYRAFTGKTKFGPNLVYDMAMDAANLKTLESVEVWAKTGEPLKWKGEITIITSESQVYQSGILELSKNGQISMSSLEYIGISEGDNHEEVHYGDEVHDDETDEDLVGETAI